jgi:hypothetical protein
MRRSSHQLGKRLSRDEACEVDICRLLEAELVLQALFFSLDKKSFFPSVCYTRPCHPKKHFRFLTFPFSKLPASARYNEPASGILKYPKWSNPTTSPNQRDHIYVQRGYEMEEHLLNKQMASVM